MDHDARIQAAITNLESQTRRNYANSDKNEGLEHITLAKRFWGAIDPDPHNTSYARRQLVDVQEQALIKYQ